MKKLILLLLFVPLFSFGQDVKVEEYFEDGNKVIEKTWSEGNQTKTLIETIEDEASGFRYFLNDNGIEVGVFFYVVREYGKYFKVELSVLNNSSNRVDFIPENIEVNVNGDVRKKEKYKQLSFEEYKLKAERRQAFQQGLVSGLQGFSEGMAGNTYSTSTSTNWDNGYPHITTTTTQSYSPALANIQRQQNQKNLNEMQEVGIEEMKFISEGYLKNHTIFPNTSLEGYILIPYHRKVTDIDLVVRIGNKEFDFSNDKWH